MGMEAANDGSQCHHRELTAKQQLRQFTALKTANDFINSPRTCSEYLQGKPSVTTEDRTRMLRLIENKTPDRKVLG